MVLSMVIALYDSLVGNVEELLNIQVIAGLLCILVLTLTNVQAYTKNGLVFVAVGNLVVSSVLIKLSYSVGGNDYLGLFLSFYALYSILFLNLHHIYTFCSKNFKK